MRWHEVAIRPVEDADLAVFFDHQRDPVAVAMAEFPARDRAPFLAHWARIRADTGVVLRTVLADGEVAGNVVSWPAGGDRLVGYWIGRRFWGGGVATRALARYLHEVADRPLLAHVAATNAGSIRVLEKCGFRPVGPGDDDPADGVAEILLRLD
jgi:RimJ/RimL family protein N-acetyltransferase